MAISTARQSFEVLAVATSVPEKEKKKFQRRKINFLENLSKTVTLGLKLQYYEFLSCIAEIIISSQEP